jgi:hypothetical protein
VKKLILCLLLFLSTAVSCSAVTIFQDCTSINGWVKQMQNYVGILTEIREPNSSRSWYEAVPMERDSFDGWSGVYHTLDSLAIPTGITAGSMPEFWMSFDYKSTTSSGSNSAFFGAFTSTGTSTAYATFDTIGVILSSTTCRPAGVLVTNTATSISAPQNNIYRVMMHVYNSGSNTILDTSLYQIDETSGVLTFVDSRQLTIMASGTSLTKGMDVFGFKNTTGGLTVNNFKFDNFYFSTDGPATDLPMPFVLEPIIAGLTHYYVAPSSQGNRNGSSAANAASYLNSALWNVVQGSLETNDVIVTFVNGNYSAGILDLSYRGNPVHKLILSAQTRYGAVINANVSHQIILVGVQNIELDGFKFTGSVSSFAVYTEYSGKKVARNVNYKYCWFKNLTNATYGAIGILDGSRNITVQNCHFDTVGIDTHAHMIYSDHDSRGITVTDSNFINCTGDYVRFRDDTDFCKVEQCTFRSTSYTYNNVFIRMPLFNDGLPWEYFGTAFQFNNNSFTYNNSLWGDRYAMSFGCWGYTPPDYNCAINAAQANLLNSGTTSQKRNFMLGNMGIDYSKLHVYNNTFSGVRYQFAYEYYDNYGAPSTGWTGGVNIPDVPDSTINGQVATVPTVINNGFEMKGYRFRSWYNIGGTSVKHAGLNGTATAAISSSANTSQELYQWVNNGTSIWAMDCLFAVGSFTGTGIKFRVDVGHNEFLDSRVSVGINNLGQVGIYNGPNFVVLPELGTIAFSVDADNNGNYSNTGDTLNWYHLRIAGNYARSTATAAVSLSNANSMELCRFSSNLAYWVNGAPSGGLSKPGLLNFYTANCAAIVDEIEFSSAYPGDCASDGHIDFKDILQMTNNWLITGTSLSCDLNNDSTVNLTDFAILAQDWLAADTQ